VTRGLQHFDRHDVRSAARVVSVIIVLMGLTLKTAYSMDKQITKLQQGQIILEHQKKILPF